MTTPPTQFPDLMAVAARDGEGGLAVEPPAITRGEDFAMTLALPASTAFGDWTSGAFAAVLRASPGAAGDPLATYSITVGTPASGVTPVTFTLLAANQSGLPAVSAATGLAEVFLGIRYTPSGGSAETIITTRQMIKGAI